MPRRFRSRISALAAAVLAAGLAGAQSFDAASVKPAAGGRPDASGGPGTKDPGRIHYANTSLQSLLLTAWDLRTFQLVAPSWTEMERYDIDAVLPPETTQAQLRGMLQNLLMARFQIKLHRETKELASDALVVASGGAKLKESTEDPGPVDESPEALRLQPGKDGFFAPPRRPGIFLQLCGMTGAREDARQTTMQELAHSLEGQLKKPVIDQTGLKGKYDFSLSFAVEGLDMGRGRLPVNAATMENPPDIGAALRSQLGLRLESRKAPVELLVIDHAEKTPTAN